MKHYNVRDKLINATVKVISTQGLDKATTKVIAKEAGLYETYIYQYFSNKENLLAETFDALDTELMHVLMENMPLFVIIDSEGNNLYESGRAAYLAE